MEEAERARDLMRPEDALFPVDAAKRGLRTMNQTPQISPIAQLHDNDELVIGADGSAEEMHDERRLVLPHRLHLLLECRAGGGTIQHLYCDWCVSVKHATEHLAESAFADSAPLPVCGRIEAQQAIGLLFRQQRRTIHRSTADRRSEGTALNCTALLLQGFNEPLYVEYGESDPRLSPRKGQSKWMWGEMEGWERARARAERASSSVRRVV